MPRPDHNKAIGHPGRRCRPVGSAKGSALTETLVSMLVLIPFFVLIPQLGKQAHVQIKSHEMLRYALWERSVWRDPDNIGGGAGLDAGNVRKSDQRIQLEALDRILGHPRAPVRSAQELAATGVSLDPLLTDPLNEYLLAGEEATDAPVRITTAGTNGIQPERGETLRNAFHLRSAPFVRMRTAIRSRPAIEQWSLDSSIADTQTPDPDGTDASMLIHDQAGALLADTWTAPSEPTFHNRIVRGTHVRDAAALTGPVLRAIRSTSDEIRDRNPWVGGDWLMGEARYGEGARLVPRSGQLPPRYVERPGS